MSYLNDLTPEQRDILLKPMDWNAEDAKLQRNLAIAPPKYRAGIEQMLRIACAKGGGRRW